MRNSKLLLKFEDELLSLNENDYKKLEQWLYASDTYYNDEPIMSDAQFDELTEELSLLNNNIVNQIIGTKIQTNEGLVNVDEVTSQMISLFKIKWNGLMTMTEVNKFLNPRRSQEIINYYSLKLDGCAIKVSKQNGTTLILTRGGQDVTDLLINHYHIKTINRPITHGELVIKKSVFQEKYSDEYENPRNCILGVLKQNPDDLDFIECTDGISPLIKSVEIENSFWKVFKGENLEQYYFQNKTKQEYQIDGIVIGYHVEKQQIKDNYPMNLVAIKFKSPSVNSKVIGIDWTQKKSGNLTPVILIEPVKLDGSTITKVSGYNYENLKLAHIGIGSIIEITKSGDIIPVVKKVITRSTNIPMPICEFKISGKHLVALNLEESISYRFILGLKLLQLDGIGPVIAEQIGQIVNFDIIELFNTEHKPKIINVLGNGAVWNNFQVFYSIKNIGLDLLIEILQFNRCGKTLSKKFAEIILKQTTNTSGIDKNLLSNVCSGEGFKKIQESMNKLKSFDIRVTKPVQINDDTISFELTGNPPGMTKNEFIKLLKQKYPNSTHTTLTKDTKYLIVDSLNSSSSKMNKARKYNSKIVTYSDALNGKL